jgi:preprotein translocase subunit SecE
MLVAEGISLEKDDATWLNVGYVVAGALVALALWNAIEMTGIQTGWQDRYDSWFPYFKNIAAVFGGIASAMWLRSDKDRHEYFLASIGELRKVSWPSALDTRRMTIVVVVVVGIFAVILSVFDLVWGNVLGMLY